MSLQGWPKREGLLSVLSHGERTIGQPGGKEHWLLKGTDQMGDIGQMEGA